MWLIPSSSVESSGRKSLLKLLVLFYLFDLIVALYARKNMLAKNFHKIKNLKLMTLSISPGAVLHYSTFFSASVFGTFLTLIKSITAIMTYAAKTSTNSFTKPLGSITNANQPPSDIIMSFQKNSIAR